MYVFIYVRSLLYYMLNCHILQRLRTDYFNCTSGWYLGYTDTLEFEFNAGFASSICMDEVLVQA